MLTTVRKAIRTMSLETNPKTIVEVEMSHLDLLVKRIATLEREVTVANREKDNLLLIIKTNKDKIDLLNELAKTCLRKKNIQEYMT